MDRFFYIVSGLGLGAAFVQIVYHFTARGNPSITKFEKSFYHFVVGTTFYALLVLVSLLHISTGAVTKSLPRIDERTEIVVQELVNNQERMNAELEQFRDVISLVLLATSLYAFSVLGLLHRWRKERKKLSQDDMRVRPLALELD